MRLYRSKGIIWVKSAYDELSSVFVLSVQVFLAGNFVQFINVSSVLTIDL